MVGRRGYVRVSWNVLATATTLGLAPACGSDFTVEDVGDEKVTADPLSLGGSPASDDGMNDGYEGRRNHAAGPNSHADERAVEAYLAGRLRGATVRERVRVGDAVFDCVDELDQPSIRALREKTGLPFATLEYPPEGAEGNGVDTVEMTGPGSGNVDAVPGQRGPACPAGAVAIRRITKEEIMQGGGLNVYFKKASPSEENYEYASVRTITDNRGGRGNLSLWNDYVESSGEHSISQIWIGRGSDSSRETVEAGWVKRLGEDAKLFVYTTPDNYATSCWNTDCGFVAYSNTGVYLDAGWENYSTVDGTQRAAMFEIRKFSTTGSWFFYLNDTLVGYWPASFFSSDKSGIREKASRFTIGGEVYGLNSDAHTATDMGSGHWPSEGWMKAAYVRNIFYRSTSNSLVTFPATVSPTVTDGNCYDGAVANNGGSWGTYLYYGGSGLNSQCQ